jgi:hypothetical protein
VESPNYDEHEGCAARGGLTTMSFHGAKRLRKKCNAMPEAVRLLLTRQSQGGFLCRCGKVVFTNR